MWTKYRVTMNFATKLVASVPADPELIQHWLESRKPVSRPPDSRSIAEVAEEVLESLPIAEADAGMNVFQRQGGGLVIRLATVRAHIKDCARTLSRLYVGKIEKELSFSVKVLHSVYYDPRIYWLPILSQVDGRQLIEPHGVYDKAVHAMTAHGQISALKRMEYVEGARLEVPLWVLTPPKSEKRASRPAVSEEDLSTLLEYGGIHGYGGERGDGEGRYLATISQIE